MKKIFLFLSILMLIAAGCNQVGKKADPANSNTQSANSSDDISTWQLYSNAEYGYQLRYPREWRLKEFSSLKEQLIQEQPYRYIVFYSPAGYGLQFGLKRKDEMGLLLSTRTGVGAGDFAKGNSVTIHGRQIPTSYLIFEGIASDIFYTDHGPGEFQLGDFMIQAEFSPRSYDTEKFYSDSNLKKLSFEQRRELLREKKRARKNVPAKTGSSPDIRNVPEAAIANKILSTLTLPATPPPSSRGVLDDLSGSIQGWAYDNGKDYEVALTFQSVSNPSYIITVSSNSSVWDEYQRGKRFDPLDGSFYWGPRPDVGKRAKGFQFTLSADRDNKQPEHRKHNVDISKGGYDYILTEATYNSKPFTLPTVPPLYQAR